MAKQSQPWWRILLTPAVLIAGFVAVTGYLETRFNSVDRRFDSVDRRFDTAGGEIASGRERTDRVIELISGLGSSVATVETKVDQIGHRVEQIAARLQVTEAPIPELSPTVNQDTQDGNEAIPTQDDDSNMMPQFAPLNQE